MAKAAKLDEPLGKVLGDKTAKVLQERLGLHGVADLLHHYPRRYARHGELTDLTELVDGEHVTVVARVQRVAGRQMRQRRGYLLEVTVTDGHGELVLAFFGQKAARYYENLLKPGTVGMFAGKVSTYGYGRKRRLQLAHPEYEPLETGDRDAALEYVNKPIPIYPAAKGLASGSIKKSVEVVLDTLGPGPDPMPEQMLRRYGLIGLRAAYEGIHRPRDWEELKRALRRLKWDEAFVVQIALARRRRAASALPAKPRLRIAGGVLDEFDRRLPFTLTEGQVEVGAQIAGELSLEHPMHRLLQGDVGAGKTMIALRAMLQVVDGAGQAALLAPTEVLAQQHHRSITTMLGPLAQAGRLGGADNATRVVLLTGSLGAKARREALLEVASGAAGIVVGTHALLQEHVRFADLGLVVIDEQHRFGVEQRDALREKVDGGRPHVLVMTATPIPRTVAMTVFGDLDTSVLTQLPAGRAEIKTYVVPPEKPGFFQRAWERIREEAARGRQTYVVCPRIGEQEDDGDGDGDGDGKGKEEGMETEEDRGEAKDAEAPRRPPLAVLDLLPRLADEYLPGLAVGVLHGRLPPDEKDAVMRRFATGELDVLLATTVVEVGVDVPNATVMVIMDADRFGVSQLHQLRGRVGRGGLPGLCLLVTDAVGGGKARQRLDAVASTTDGFQLSRLDLEQRREGDVLGATQAGRTSSLRLLTLLRDEDLITCARKEATALVDADPDLTDSPALAAELAALLDEERAGYLEKA